MGAACTLEQWRGSSRPLTPIIQWHEHGRVINLLKYLKLLVGEPGKPVQVYVGQELWVEEPLVDPKLSQGGPAPPASSQPSSSPTSSTLNAAISLPQGVMASTWKIAYWRLCDEQNLSEGFEVGQGSRFRI